MQWLHFKVTLLIAVKSKINFLLFSVFCNYFLELKQKSLLGSEAENRLLSSLNNVERVIAGT